MEMNNEQLRQAREEMCLTTQEMAKLCEVDVSSVYKWERDPALATARPAPVRVARLIRAYLKGFRPDDWPEDQPERVTRREEARAAIREVKG